MSLTDDELKDLAQEQAKGGPQPGEHYLHYKRAGGLYRIIARAIHEATLELLVIYKSLRHGTTWARTLANFTEMVDDGGRMVPRFERAAWSAETYAARMKALDELVAEAQALDMGYGNDPTGQPERRT